MPKVVKLYGRKPYNKDAYGKDWSATTKSVKQRDAGKCVECGSTKDVQLHHIIPLTKGGTNHGFNLISLCETCHCKRHAHMKNKVRKPTKLRLS